MKVARIGRLIIAHIDLTDRLAAAHRPDIGGDQVPLIHRQMPTLARWMQLVAMLIHCPGVAQVRAIGEEQIHRHTSAVGATGVEGGRIALRIDPVRQRRVGSDHDVLAAQIKDLHIRKGGGGALVHARIGQCMQPCRSDLLELGQVQHARRRFGFAGGGIGDGRWTRLLVAELIIVQGIPGG